jgi:hypothetical protein
MSPHLATCYEGIMKSVFRCEIVWNEYSAVQNCDGRIKYQPTGNKNVYMHKLEA